MNAPTPAALELTAPISEVYQRGYSDINFFSAIVLGDVMEYPFPEFYVNIHLMLLKALIDRNNSAIRKILRIAIGLPRGFAKTTFMKVLAVWLLAYDFSTFILITCATEPLAENFLADLDDMLSDEQFQAIYGRWTANKGIDNQQKKTCMFRNRPVLLVAIGAGTSVRGLNLKHRRPDTLLCDDMQTEANDRSETDRERLFDWFIGTLLKLVTPSHSLAFYLGNMYSDVCILYKLKLNPYWISLITGCILSDKKSLWEEVHPIEALRESFNHDQSLNRAAIWLAEMMNDPISARVALLPDGLIPECEFDEEHMVPDFGFLTIDPAGFKLASDDNVVIAHYILDSKPVVVEVSADKFNPEQLILEAFRMCMLHNIHVIGVESVAYQSTLLFWFNKYIPVYNMHHIQVVELSPRGRQKEQRIRTWISTVLSGSYQVFGNARQKIVWQAAQYKIGKKDNRDDILDGCAYGQDMINEYWDIITSVQLKNVRTIDAHVVSNNTPF
jgi:hypothetical protein